MMANKTQFPYNRKGTYLENSFCKIQVIAVFRTSCSEISKLFWSATVNLSSKKFISGNDTMSAPGQNLLHLEIQGWAVVIHSLHRKQYVNSNMNLLCLKYMDRTFFIIIKRFLSLAKRSHGMSWRIYTVFCDHTTFNRIWDSCLFHLPHWNRLDSSFSLAKLICVTQISITSAML